MKKIRVKITANFEKNLHSIEAFLAVAQQPLAFDALLEELLETVIPALEQFPQLGKSFLALPTGSVESLKAQQALQKKIAGAQVRQYVMNHYLLLYAVVDANVYLLSIKHHRELSFDLNAMWLDHD